MPRSSRKTQEIERSLCSKLDSHPGEGGGLCTPATHPVLSVSICTVHGQSKGCTSHLCGPQPVSCGCLEHLAPPASPVSLCWSYRWLPGQAGSRGSSLSGAPLNPPKKLLGEVPSSPSGRLSWSSWACSSHTPDPLGRVAWAFEQLPKHKISINVFSGRR